ncbi:phospholipase D-like domain-containing protein [Aliarcobacter cryaerophilus]|uniref:phospholipase D-like domain-containing protein n=1 Tax=Aliarcobacter cryaerophilus TaxID=28198 RepID=UPI000EB05049|nr:phospholipase D-like domain-containing protein [Aliarcobacter cryaerophilus]AYJ77765.1 hypothetical protein ACRYD_0613 [Aliarcobacter cryaerophilus D2610]
MNNIIEYKEILARKYYEYYHDDNYELYDIQEFYYPYFKITCNCIFREKTQLSIVEEIFLNAIKEGIDDLKKLEQFLSIDKEVFEELAARLHIDNLFIEMPILMLTEEGIKTLNENSSLTITEDDKYLILDGILGIPVSIDIKDEREKNINNTNNLKVQIPYPKTESLDKNINNKALQTILFETFKNSNKKDKEIYEIKEILETYQFHKKYIALFFKNDNNPKKILILNDGCPNDELTNLITKFEQEGNNLFDFSKESKKEQEELYNVKNIYEYAEIDKLSNGTQLSTYQHPKFFDYALKYSKKEIILVSPWIKWEVISSKKIYIENALKRNVKIILHYGMCSKDKDDIDDKSNDFFKKLKKKYKDLLIININNISDHSKILICDRDWMITTSFNWTSFKGDISKQERKERGSFINDKNEIEKVVKEYSHNISYL